MARLAEGVIEQIKQEVSLVRLVESQGHQLKKHGKDYALNCPFHVERAFPNRLFIEFRDDFTLARC